MKQTQNREKAIFQQALEKETAEERSAFLDRQCGDDNGLRQRVEELLNSLDNAGSFLDGGAVEPAAIVEALDMAVPSAGGVITEGPGTVIGRYKLMEQIGEGGFGLVFVAEQQQPVRRRVALKVIKPGMDSRDVIGRFEAERQALALMDHPNIARVLDAGTTDAGRPYFVMELVRGIPITEYCDQVQLSPRDRLELFVPVCRAIQHAHQKGIIHRDVKPSNVLVTLHDGEPVVKVIDFGVAKALNQQLTQKTIYTKFAQMIGTPLYMSPEQAEMSGLDVDTRSDIYYLGVLLYELLTGSTPFDRERLSEAAFDEIRRIIREEEPPKPSTRLSKSGDRLPSLAAQRKTVPAKLSKVMRGELDWIVMKALEKDRRRRYETANGFAADILRYLNDDTVVACPPTAGYRLRKFARRHKTLLATSAMVAAALIAGTTISTWQAVRASHAEARSDLSAATARDRATEARANSRIAKEETARALASKHKLRERVYASDMNAISDAYANGAIDRMNDLLANHRPRSPEEDQRGFEWYYWWHAGHLEQGNARHPLTAAFRQMAVSPDGQTIALSGWPRHLYLYDTKQLCPLRLPIQFDGEGSRLCFSPDGRFLVVGSGFRSVGARVLDTKSWDTIATMPGDFSVTAFATVQPLMVIGSWQESHGEIQLWTWTNSSWELLDRWGANGKVEDLGITPDGKTLVAHVKRNFYGESRIDIWDVQEGKSIRSLDVDGPQATGISSIVLSRDGNYVAVGEKDGDIHLWRSDSLAAKDPPRPLRTLLASAPVASLAFSPDGTRLVAGTAETNNMIIWELKNLEKEETETPITVHAHSRAVQDVKFGRDSNTVYSAGEDGYLKVWDLSNCQPYDTIRGVDPMSQVGYADDNTLIFNDHQGMVQRWDVKARKRLTPLDKKSKYYRIALSDDGGYLAGVTHNDELRVWNLASRGKVHETSVHAESDCSLVVSRDGRRVAYLTKRRAGQDAGFGDVSLFDLEHATQVTADDSFLFNRVSLKRQAFSPDSKTLVIQRAGSFRYSSHLLDITAGTVKQRLQLSGWGPENCAAFSPDGTTLAIGSYNYDIRLYDAGSGELKDTLRGHTEPLQSLAFTRDGSRLVSAGSDATVRIWKIGASKWRLLSTMRAPSRRIEFVAVSPTGTSVASVSHDGTLLIWRTATQQGVEQNVDRQLAQAQNSFPSGDAIAQLDDAHQIDPNNCKVLLFRGSLRYAMGDWNEAIADFTDALKLVPGNACSLQFRAEARAQAGQRNESLDDWTRLVQLTEGRNTEYLFRRGESYVALGRRADARADFVRALTRSPPWQAKMLLRRVESSLLRAEAIVPTGAAWRYSTDRPPADRYALAGDVSSWPVGAAPFGTGTRTTVLPKTRWTNSPDIWLQQTFELDQAIEAPLVFHVLADDEVTIYVNGALATSVGRSENYQTVEWKANLRQGANTVVVHGHDRAGSESAAVDVGLYIRGDPTTFAKVLAAAVEQAPAMQMRWSWSELLVEQGRRQVENEQWKEAAAAFGKAVELNPTDALNSMQAAILYAYNEDFDRFHQLSIDSLEQFGETKVPDVAEKVAKACLVAAPQEANLLATSKLADKALTLDPDYRNGEFIPWAQLTKGLAEYRAGNGQAANEWVEKCVANSANMPVRKALALGVRSLAWAQLGDGNASREAMVELTGLLQEHSPFHTGAKLSDNWHDWLACELLLREIRQAHTDAEQ
jgi:WD40 repeat protein/tetratricopeptide (TPR) repeat protein